MAPTWYAEIVPQALDVALGSPATIESTSGSPQRLKRELGTFLQEVTRLHPLVLFVDDLQWADVSTVDLTAYLASRFDSIRLLMVAAYRPSELRLARHPFLQLLPDLQARGVCRELALGFLTRPDVERYLALEFPDHRLPTALSELIHGKTEGSPLFVTDLVRYLRDRHVVAESQGHWVLQGVLPEIQHDLPESMRAMIERKIAQLEDEDRRLLVAASVQGYEFDSAIVAQVLALDAADVEERLARLERVHAFVRMVEERELPDHTLTLRYRFVHMLYQNALYGSLGPARRADLSRSVADAMLACHGGIGGTVASELASLFEAARDLSRAADSYVIAAQSAARIFAYQEVITLAQRGLKLLKKLPDTPERRRQELDVLTVLGPAVSVIKGYAVPEVVQIYTRARELCQQSGEEAPRLFAVLYNLWMIHDLRGEQQRAFELAEQCLGLAERAQDSGLLLLAREAMGESLLFSAEFESAREHLEQAFALYDAERHHTLAVVYQYDAGVICSIPSAHALWHLGYPDQALKKMQTAATLAGAYAQPHSLALAWCHAALLHHLRGETRAARDRAEAALALADEQGLQFFLAYAHILLGRAQVQEGGAEAGIAQIRQGMAGYRATGSEAEVPFFTAFLADACLRVGRTEEALDALDEALAFGDRTGTRYHEAELYRLKGHALRSQTDGRHESAEQCFGQAIQVARRQRAKSLELRAATTLSRVYQEQGRRAEGRLLLAEAYGWFTEGFETADLKEARVLLEDLA